MTGHGYPGLFITFEGPDGSGKSANFTAASRYLEDRYGLAIIRTQEPGGTPLADEVRAIFKNDAYKGMSGLTEIALLNAARSDHLHRVIKPGLAAGSLVMSDRFFDSTRAYQGYGRGIAQEDLLNAHSIFSEKLTPDLTLLFDAPVEVCQERSNKRNGRRITDRLDNETLGFYTRVREGYLWLASQEPKRFRVIETTKTVEENAADVREVLDEYFAQHPEILARLKKAD